MINLKVSGGIFCLELQRGQEIYNKKENKSIKELAMIGLMNKKINQKTRKKTENA